MVERGSLLLLLGSEPASVQQVYALLLHVGWPLQAYHVYCNLRKLGYIMQRYGTPWVHPVSQSRRKLEAEKKDEGGLSAGAEGGGLEVKVEEGEASAVKSKGAKGEGLVGGEKKGKGKKAQGGGGNEEGVSKKEGKGKGGRKGPDTEAIGSGSEEKKASGDAKGGAQQSSNGDAGSRVKNFTAGELREGSVGEQGLSSEGQKEKENRVPAQPMSLAEDGAVSADRDGSTSSDTPLEAVNGTARQQTPAASEDALLSSEEVANGSSASSRESTIPETQDPALSAGSRLGPQSTGGDPTTQPAEEVDSALEPAPDLTEESVTNAETEDFRKGPVLAAPASCKRQKPGPLDLNEACTFVNLNVKNYHPLAPYLFLGNPKKRIVPKSAPGSEGEKVSGNGPDEPGVEEPLEEAPPNENGVPHQAALRSSDPRVEESSHSPARLQTDVRIDILPEDQLPTSETPLTSAEQPVSDFTNVDVGLLHELLDMSRCTMPPPIPKPSTWQKLRWRLGRFLKWRLWPWRWGRGGKLELGRGETMRPFPRPLKEQLVGNGSGRRVFPEKGVGGELTLNAGAEGLGQKISLESVSSGGLRKQLLEAGDIFPEMWADDVDERLAHIRVGKSVVYDVWQPNSRFRKTDPGLPFFRLVICG
jgi:hypothetical protein